MHVGKYLLQTHQLYRTFVCKLYVVDRPVKLITDIKLVLLLQVTTKEKIQMVENEIQGNH